MLNPEGGGEAGPAAAGDEPATILVIEDSPAARMFVRVTLELEGYLVLEAATGVDGLDVLRARPDVSVVVLDLVLPDIEGLRVAAEIRSVFGRSVGVVAFTGAVPTEHGAPPAGIDAVVLKPARPEVLSRAVLASVPRERLPSRAPVEVQAPGDLEIAQLLSARLNTAGFRADVVDVGARSGNEPPRAVVVWAGAAAEGFAIAARLRLDEERRLVPVVLAATEFPTLEDREFAGAVGASTITLVDNVADAVNEALAAPVPPPPRSVPTDADRLAYLERHLRRTTRAAGGGPTRDALTGLPVREYLAFSARRLIEDARRRGARVAGLLIGLDRFARINDALGRAAADLVLREVGTRLSQFEPYHAIGRIEADRFGLLTVDAEHDSAVLELAGAVLDEVARPYHVHGLELYLTASVGITRLVDATPTAITTAMAEAEMALRRAKEHGGNQAVLYRQEWEAEARRAFALEQDLRDALLSDDSGLFLEFQPRVDLRTGEVTGGEALLRWNHPSLGWLGPGEFIPIAERTGLIVDLGAWVLAGGARQAATWHAAGRQVAVAVNVGAGQLHGDTFLPALVQIIVDHQLPPGALELEITETTAMEDLDHAARTLRAARAHGVRIALDDFGTGYSSLAYLRRLPVDVVKLDRAFVVDLPTDAAARDTVEAVVSLGNKQGFLVVGEGVETREELAALIDLGCGAAQGFLFDGAISAHVFEQLIAQPQPYRQVLAVDAPPTPPA